MTVELLSPAQIAVHSGHSGVIYQDKDTGTPYFWNSSTKEMSPIGGDPIERVSTITTEASDQEAVLDVIINGRNEKQYTTDTGDWAPLIASILQYEVPAAGRARFIFRKGGYDFGSLLQVDKERITFELDEKAEIRKNWWNAGANTNSLIQLVAGSNGFRLTGGGRLVGQFNYATYGNATNLTAVSTTAVQTGVVGAGLYNEALLRIGSPVASAWTLEDLVIEDVLFSRSANYGILSSMGFGDQRIKSLKVLGARFSECLRPIYMNTGDTPERVGVGSITMRGLDVRKTWNPTAEPYNWGGDDQYGTNGITLNGASYDEVLLEDTVFDEVGRIGFEQFNNNVEGTTSESRNRKYPRATTVRGCTIRGRYRSLSLIYVGNLRVVENTIYEPNSYIELFGRSVAYERNRSVGGGVHFSGLGFASTKVDAVQVGATDVLIAENEFVNPPPFQPAISMVACINPQVKRNTVYFDDGLTNYQATRSADIYPTRRESSSSSNVNIQPCIRIRDSMHGEVQNNRIVFRAGVNRLPLETVVDINGCIGMKAEKMLIQTEHSIDNAWSRFNATSAASAAGDSGSGNTLRIRPGETVSNGTLTGTVMYVTKRTDTGAMVLWCQMSTASDFSNGNTLTGQTSGATCTISSAPTRAMNSPLIELGGMDCKFIGWRTVLESKLGGYPVAATGSVRISATATALKMFTYNSAANPRWGAGTDITSVLHDPPGVPSVGPYYLIADTPTGDWIGHAGELATWGGASWTFTQVKGMLYRNSGQSQLGWQVATYPTMAYGNSHQLPRPWNASGFNSWTGTAAPTNGDTFLAITGGSVNNQFIDCDFDVCQAEPLWQNGVGSIDAPDSSVVAYVSTSSPGGVIWGDRWEGCAQAPTRLGYSSTKLATRWSMKPLTDVPKLIPFASSIRLDAQESSHFLFNLTGNLTLTAPRHKFRGRPFVLEFRQGGAGGFTLAATGSWTAAGVYQASGAWLTNIPGDFSSGTPGQRRLLYCQWLADTDAACVVWSTPWV